MPALTQRFRDALVFATECHEGQCRKGSPGRKGSPVPYVSHPLQVAGIVLEHGGDEDEAIAALLHDVLEDSDVTKAEIVRRFGSHVADIVEACSDTTEKPKPPWRARKDRHLAHLAEADASAALVSAADKLHNARSIVSDFRLDGDAIWDRFRGGKPGTLWYYERIVDVVRGRVPDALFQELERSVGTLLTLAG